MPASVEFYSVPFVLTLVTTFGLVRELRKRRRILDDQNHCDVSQR